MNDVLVFARAGRSNAEGAFATCHCLSLPASEPGYYFWRDRSTHTLTRRSEWFVTKSPEVTVGSRPIKYMISFALPRFCDQSLTRSRKEKFYPGADPWIAKLDTVVHELYHIDPELAGIRRIKNDDGVDLANCHGRQFLETVAGLVHTYLESRPSRDAYDFLRHDFGGLHARHGGISGTSFRRFPSFPQRYIERLAEQPRSDADAPGVKVEPLEVVLPVTRRVHELVPADRDRHVRGPGLGRRKEDDVARRQIPRLPDRFSHPILLADLAREREAMLGEDVLSKPAAVEAVRIDAAVAVRRAPQRERRARQRVAVDAGAGASRSRARRRGQGRRGG